MVRSRVQRVIAVLAAGLLLLAFCAGLVSAADPTTVPNGPWVTDTQNVSLSGISSYDQIMKTIKQVEQSSQGAVQVITPKYRAKASGRVLPAVKIGNGLKAMMIITQQHGDEFVTTEGALNLIQTLGANSKEAKAIRDAITLIVMPRVNVDGFDATPTGSPWRYDIDPTAFGPFSSRNRGYDINRYHPMELPLNPYYHDPAYPQYNDPAHPERQVPQANPVPEALAVRDLFEQYKPEVFMDMHHQGTYVDPNDPTSEMVTASTLWPTAVGVNSDVQTRAKKVVSTLYTKLEQYGYAHVTRYPGDTYPGIARNRYGLLGSAAVLVELRGSQEQKSNGNIAKTGYQAMMSVVEAFASGTLDQADPAIADNMPDRTGWPSANRDLPSNGGEVEDPEGA